MLKLPFPNNYSTKLQHHLRDVCFRTAPNVVTLAKHVFKKTIFITQKATSLSSQIVKNRSIAHGRLNCHISTDGKTELISTDGKPKHGKITIKLQRKLPLHTTSLKACKPTLNGSYQLKMARCITKKSTTTRQITAYHHNDERTDGKVKTAGMHTPTTHHPFTCNISHQSIPCLVKALVVAMSYTTGWCKYNNIQQRNF